MEIVGLKRVRFPGEPGQEANIQGIAVLELCLALRLGLHPK